MFWFCFVKVFYTGNVFFYISQALLKQRSKLRWRFILLCPLVVAPLAMWEWIAEGLLFWFLRKLYLNLQIFFNYSIDLCIKKYTKTHPEINLLIFPFIWKIDYCPYLGQINLSPYLYEYIWVVVSTHCKFQCIGPWLPDKMSSLTCHVLWHVLDHIVKVLLWQFF